MALQIRRIFFDGQIKNRSHRTALHLVIVSTCCCKSLGGNLSSRLGFVWVGKQFAIYLPAGMYWTFDAD